LEFAREAIARLAEQATDIDLTLGIPELDSFAGIGLITRIHSKLTSGKEGTVYCCRAHPSTRKKFLAAKVYREHAACAHMWSETYFEGRERVLKAQMIRAIHARTEFGKEMARSLWVSAEFEMLQYLHRAGVSSPEPIAAGSRTILMEYIGNGAGPAPHLRGLNPTREEARRLFDQILDDIVCMLRNHTVHADLSPYNILVWKGQARVIDVPQAVDARFNRAALELLRRDVANVCGFFEPFGIDTNPERLAHRLWDDYQRAAL